MRCLLFVIAMISAVIGNSQVKRYIQVSKENPNYFSFSDGSTYIPVGINMINPSRSENADAALQEIGEWMRNLSSNGGNYVRVWLSQEFWDIEEKAGVYNEEKAKRIDKFIEMARQNHLHIKLTLEHFRSITLEENPQKWATKFAYHTSNGGPLDSIRQYLTTAAGRKLFLDKIDYYKNRYGSDTLFFGWELWNEMNAVKGPEDSVFYEWNETMLKEVKKRFPENLVMQSLGSFDGDYAKPVYEKIMAMPGNEVAQVHRYLDPGAQFEVCHAPMDIICSSAIKDLQTYHLKKPVLLAETGAVEPHHAGPSKYYPVDTAGILLHDILFAPFFTGSAGTGMSWHWESYVDRNKLWYHYGRFSNAIAGVDPVREGFKASFMETPALRVYTLKGKYTTLMWVRDKNSNWQTELDQHVAAATLRGVVLPVGRVKKISVYDPWEDRWVDVVSRKKRVVLPDFRRSVVVKIEN